MVERCIRRDSMGSEGLAKAIREVARKGSPTSGVSVRPGCAFGAVIEERMKGLETSMAEVKLRLNGLIFLVVGAVLVEIVMRFLGS